jgi:hypothetical protein
MKNVKYLALTAILVVSPLSLSACGRQKPAPIPIEVAEAEPPAPKAPFTDEREPDAEILIPDYEKYAGEPIADYARGGLALFSGLFSETTGLETITDNFKRPITRAEFAKLSRLFLEYKFDFSLALPEVSELDDTQDPDALKIYNAGLMRGRGRREFAPEGYIRREEAAACIINAAQAIEAHNPDLKARLEPPIAALPTEDAGDVSEQYGIEVRSTYANGLMTGATETKWAPNGALTVEQALRVFDNLYRFYSEKSEN